MFTKKSLRASGLGAGALAAMLALPVASQAAIVITEVAPWSSGGSALGADWFELTNTGSTAVNITGWRVDDSSDAYGNALLLNGITSIGAGESVIFIEGPSSNATVFNNLWFGTPTSSLQIGYYSGNGIGLSTGGDGLTIFNTAQGREDKVSFGASDENEPLQTFYDPNPLGNTPTLTLLSVAGVNGAFDAASNPGEIGSPGVAPAPVPLPAAAWLLLSGLGVFGAAAKRKRA